MDGCSKTELFCELAPQTVFDCGVLVLQFGRESVRWAEGTQLLQRARLFPSRWCATRRRVCGGSLVQASLSDARCKQVGRFVNDLAVHVSFLLREKNVSPDICEADVAPRADEVALVMRFCVQLLLERGAATPSSQNPLEEFFFKKKMSNSSPRLLVFLHEFVYHLID